MKVTHVQLTYFKDHGKYYSEGELDLPYKNDTGGERPWMFHEVLAHVREMLVRGERPGLVDGQDFHTLVTVFTQYGPLRHVLTRDVSGALR